MKTNSAEIFLKMLGLLVLAVLPFATKIAAADTNSVPTTKSPCCQKIENSAPQSDRSVYQLSSDWTTDAGKEIKLNALRGKPQVVAMIFTSCQGACPILVHQIQQLAESLQPGMATNVGFLLVTFDTERDTPAVLHAYRTTRNLSGDHWTLLHGRPEDVRELALVLGVKYRRDAGGQFSHSNLITILNAEGEISYQQTGLDNSGDELAKRLVQLLKP